ncbi:helix-turn-helix domain-containing protein [Rahnella sp. Lac-M11]|uniref:Helix-turn-helix domain-containing protein n=1 Tax=Rahnella contaminans TaxID=2703882 RepID=A0A6M2B5R3_9GAMM|nr:helix-turn-helix transcriptional regulator [Rahnella contaminans]NGX87804.1 helix-turn-helix domain-containing protein [Rahnella contaminans]
MIDNIESLSGPGALGAFLRTHRERVTPEMVGLPGSARRRTSGLRREELAQISGISATWYTWIEQGRDVSVSAATLDRLAKSLQMEPAAREYLFSLASVKDPLAVPLSGAPDDSLKNCVNQITGPGYLLDSCWNVLAWNPPAGALFSGWLGKVERPNLLDFMFLHPLSRQLVPDWAERAKRVVAEFRAETSHYAHSDAVRQKVISLRGQSSEFNQWWTQQEVLAREGGARRFNHPLSGETRYRQQTFFPAGYADCKLVMLVPES